MRGGRVFRRERMGKKGSALFELELEVKDYGMWMQKRAE